MNTDSKQKKTPHLWSGDKISIQYNRIYPDLSYPDTSVIQTQSQIPQSLISIDLVWLITSLFQYLCHLDIISPLFPTEKRIRYQQKSWKRLKSWQTLPNITEFYLFLHLGVTKLFFLNWYFRREKLKSAKKLMILIPAQICLDKRGCNIKIIHTASKVVSQWQYSLPFPEALYIVDCPCGWGCCGGGCLGCCVASCWSSSCSMYRV